MDIVTFKTTVLDKDYNDLSIPLKKLVPAQSFGLPKNFYGGRVTHVGVVKDTPLLLLIDNSRGMTVIDIGVERDKVDLLPIEILKRATKSINLPIDKRAVKEEIVEAIKNHY